MKTVVIMPGGFHPFHSGHLALYRSAQRTFPDAEIYVAATDDTSQRPFPFGTKEALARLSGVEPGHFVKVKSPFQAREITSRFDPERDQVIFVRSEKDVDKQPRPGGHKRDGSPAYLQPLLGARRLEPFGKHAYMAYLPTVTFGPGITSATEIRTAWPQLDQRRKQGLVQILYPALKGDKAKTNQVINMLDDAIQPMDEGQGWAATFTSEQRPGRIRQKLEDWAQTMERMTVGYIREEDPDYIEEKWSEKYKRSINCANPKGFSQRAHCAGRKK